MPELTGLEHCYKGRVPCHLYVAHVAPGDTYAYGLPCKLLPQEIRSKHLDPLVSDCFE